jgi:fatty acid desaturase
MVEVIVRQGEDTPDFVETVGGEAFSRRDLSEEIRSLSRVSNGLAAWAIARQWLVIAATLALALAIRHWLVWMLAGAIIATRQMTLLVIMHEAVHYHLFSSRRWSEVVSDLFCAFPMHFTTAGFRLQHLEHHSAPNTPDDPYWMNTQADPQTWTFPRRPREVLRIFLFDLLGLHVPRWLRIGAPWTYFYRLLTRTEPRITVGEHLRYLGFLGALVTFLTWTHGWVPYLVLWTLPSLTIGMAMFRMRALGEHCFDPATNELNGVRLVEGTLLERHSIAPLNINYHIEHHFYPSVPYYHLPAIRELLAAQGIYEEGRNYFRTYLHPRRGVLGWLMAKERGAAPARGGPGDGAVAN